MTNFLPETHNLNPLKAKLPVVPMTGTHIPTFEAETRAYRRVRCLAHNIHYVAFVTRYGPAPEGVKIRVDHSYAACDQFLAEADPRASTEAKMWVEAFECGLTTWREAGFEDPVDVETNSKMTEVSCSDYDEVVNYAAYKLVKQERLDELRNLWTVASDVLKARFHPDNDPENRYQNLVAKYDDIRGKNRQRPPKA